MPMTFTASLFHWRGPAPHYFLRVPDDLATELKTASKFVTYGWGMIPVTVEAGGFEYDTSLFPKDGGYLVPVRGDVRKAHDWQEGDDVPVTLELRSGAARRSILKKIPEPEQGDL